MQYNYVITIVDKLQKLPQADSNQWMIPVFTVLGLLIILAIVTAIILLQ